MLVGSAVIGAKPCCCRIATQRVDEAGTSTIQGIEDLSGELEVLHFWTRTSLVSPAAGTGDPSRRRIAVPWIPIRRGWVSFQQRLHRWQRRLDALAASPFCPDAWQLRRAGSGDGTGLFEQDPELFPYQRRWWLGSRSEWRRCSRRCSNHQERVSIRLLLRLRATAACGGIAEVQQPIFRSNYRNRAAFGGNCADWDWRWRAESSPQKHRERPTHHQCCVWGIVLR